MRNISAQSWRCDQRGGKSSRYQTTCSGSFNRGSNVGHIGQYNTKKTFLNIIFKIYLKVTLKNPLNVNRVKYHLNSLCFLKIFIRLTKDLLLSMESAYRFQIPLIIKGFCDHKHRIKRQLMEHL